MFMSLRISNVFFLSFFLLNNVHAYILLYVQIYLSISLAS